MSARFLRISCGLVVIVGFTAAARADLVYTQTIGELSARVTFAQDADNLDNLLVTLENISPYDVVRPSQLLTGVFFNITGATLTTERAVLTDGSVVRFGYMADYEPLGDPTDGLDSNYEVGGEWGYRSDLAEGLIFTGATHVIASAGLEDLVGVDHLFPGEDIDSPLSPNGLNYGILSEGDDWTTGNTPVTGTEPLIDNGVIFTLSGLGGGVFDVKSNITDIAFNYGTDLNVVPAPPAALLGLVGLALVGWVKRKVS